jgi:hypothetical protein
MPTHDFPLITLSNTRNDIPFRIPDFLDFVLRPQVGGGRKQPVNLTDLIVGFCILLRVYPLTQQCFCALFYCALFTICFGPDRWPSSGNMYIKYTKVTTVYVNGSVEIAA